ncbi:MAG: cobalt-precorrin-6A reductase [Elainellaceae cyanobacterium]
MAIWLIGGTQESAELAQQIIKVGLPCVVTVTTASARSLYPATPGLQLRVGGLSTEQISDFLQAYQVGCILDASHPFAVEISRLAIATARQLQLPYLRYERPGISAPTQASLLRLSDFQTLLTGNYLTNQRVLLTIGYRNLAQFQDWQERTTLFARILPSVSALEAALTAGFSPDRLIALRPPLSIELEKALWQHWQISLVVTKASGAAGGEDVKHQVAADLGTKLIVIDRPPIAYPQLTSDLQAALKFCQAYS